MICSEVRKEQIKIKAIKLSQNQLTSISKVLQKMSKRDWEGLELVQQLGTLTALLEDPSSTSSTHMQLTALSNSSTRDPTPSSDHCRHRYTQGAHTYTQAKHSFFV